MARWLSKDNTGKVYRVRIVHRETGETLGSFGPYATLGAAKSQRTRERQWRSWDKAVWLIEVAQLWSVMDEDVQLDIDE